MTDMVEKVARAVCKSGKFETGEGTCALRCLDQLGSARDSCPHVKKVHGDLARAAIRALMEPTEGMLAATIYEYDHAKALRDGEAPFAVDVWQAMLKAALDE